MPDTQLRIGMIGVTGRGGLWRRWHQPQGRSVIVAGADVNPHHLEAFRLEHGRGPFITTDYRDLLARPDVDATAVASPDDCHEEHAVIGTQGRIENSEPEMKVWVKTRKSNSWRDLADRTYDIKSAEGGHGGADPVICRDFVEMCLDGVEPLAPPLAGRMSVAAGVRAAHTLRHGGLPVDMPPLPEDIR